MRVHLMKKPLADSTKGDKLSDDETMDSVLINYELEQLKLKFKSLQERFDALFEKTNDAIFIIDQETEMFIFANKKAAEMFGFDLKDTTRYTAKDFIPDDEFPDASQKMVSVKSGEILSIYERKFRKLSGEIFYGEINLSLVHDSSTGTDYVQSIIRDITRRKQKKDIITRDRQIYHDIANAAFQTTNIPEFCNRVLSTLLDKLAFSFGSLRVINEEYGCFEPLAVQGLPDHLSQTLKPITLDDTEYIICEVLHTRKPIYVGNFTKHSLMEKYKERIELFNIKAFISWPIINKKNKLIGAIQLSSSESKDILEDDKFFFESIIGLLVNVLERFIAERDLQDLIKEREQLNQIINLSPVIVFLWKNEKGWPVEFVSDNITQFGYSQEEFQTGEVLYIDIIHQDDLDQIISNVEKFIKDPNINEYSLQYRIITKTGSIRWIVEYTTIRRDDEKNVDYFMGIVIDNTERKLAETALQSERRAFQMMADAAAISKNVPELCQFILNGLVEAFKFDVGSIRLYHEETRLLIPVATVGFSEFIGMTEVPVLSIDDPDYINALVARTKKGIFAPDVKKSDLLIDFYRNLDKINISSLIAYPILDSNNELIGTLQLAARNPKDLPFEDSILFETIAETLSHNIDRLQVDEARRESEEKFRAFAEQSLIGVMLFKRNGEFLFFNKQMENITEYTVTELMEMSMLDFLKLTNIDDISDIMQKIDKQKSIEADKPLVREFQFRTKSDLTKWLSMNLTPITISNEIAFASLFVDITKQKQAQLSLIRERELLKMVSEATANNFYVADLCANLLEGIIKILNLDAGSLRLFNKNDNSLISIADYGLKEDEKLQLTPIIINETEHPLIDVLKQENMIFCLDASKHPLLKTKPLVEKHEFKSYIFWPIISAKKTFIGTLQIGARRISNLTEDDRFIFESITEIVATSIEHIQALEELRLSEEKFKRTVDNISDGILIIENHELIYANNRVQEILGYSFEEIKKMDVHSIVSPAESDKFIVEIEKMRAGLEHIPEQEYWYIAKDGSRKYINSTLSMNFGEDGKYSLYILIRDFTDKKIAEEELQKLNEELEERVKERTQQLEQVNKELEAFSYSVSHDLRTPLRSIDGFSQVLLEDFSKHLDTTGQDYLQRIRTSTKRMSNLIDDLLALSRLTRKELSIEQIDLTKICNEVFEELKINEPSRKIRVSIERGMKLNGDPTLIRTVIENLIGNSWKFTRKKALPKIIFGTKTIKNEKIYFIEDNGVGFDMAYANKLFTVFQRLHSYKEFEGTGIGLAIVQRIINRHGGKIWAEGKVNKGATFYFTIQQDA
ncbi:MAG: PAS domain S-box protein [Asgard group archaeon]|nr:PAS domain S-box protein [Asgard group archaeon]